MTEGSSTSPPDRASTKVVLLLVTATEVRLGSDSSLPEPVASKVLEYCENAS